MKFLLYMLLSLPLWTACTQSPARQEECASDVPATPVTPVRHNDEPRSRDTLYAFTCNGKVVAARYADLHFRANGLVTAVYKKNGDRVRKGEPIAQQETVTQEKELRQCQTALQQAALEMQDILIGQGFDPDHQENVPEEMMKLIRVKSGYEQAELNLQAARISLEEATLKAPFAGIIANLTVLPHNNVPTEAVCRVIDVETLEVEFKVQENELSALRRGDAVEVLLYGGMSEAVNATVSEINPLVEEDGSVKLKARLGQDPRLLAGMNVQVRIRKP